MQLFNVISRLLTNGHFPYTGGIRPHPHDQPQNQSLQPFEDTSEVKADGGHFDVKAVGLVTLAFRSLNSFMRPFVRMPRGFFHLATSAVVVDYKNH